MPKNKGSGQIVACGKNTPLTLIFGKAANLFKTLRALETAE